MAKVYLRWARMRKYVAFTLIETLLVVLVIGILVAMVVPRMSGRTEQARVIAAGVDINTKISTALELYKMDNYQFPTTEEGLKALLSRPASATNWNGPYLEKNPIDPWDQEYQYKSSDEIKPVRYDLYSLGRDGEESEDDIRN